MPNMGVNFRESNMGAPTPNVIPAPVDLPKSCTIEKVANGFIIVVGCKTLVAKTWDEAARGLGEYWDNPAEAEKKYCK